MISSGGFQLHSDWLFAYFGNQERMRASQPPTNEYGNVVNPGWSRIGQVQIGGADKGSWRGRASSDGYLWLGVYFMYGTNLMLGDPRQQNYSGSICAKIRTEFPTLFRGVAEKLGWPSSAYCEQKTRDGHPSQAKQRQLHTGIRRRSSSSPQQGSHFTRPLSVRN